MKNIDENPQYCRAEQIADSSKLQIIAITAQYMRIQNP